MAMANPLLLGGLILVGIPILLHLVMRQQPKHLMFPAIRFIQQRRESNRRKLQLRHWLLLILRCLAIAALVAALTRPSAKRADYGNWIIVAASGTLAVLIAIMAVFAFINRNRMLGGIFSGVSALLLVVVLVIALLTAKSGTSLALGDREAPVAAVIVIDTSPRMLYRQANQTRLETAQETALWLIDEFPAESQIAVVDSRRGEPFFSVDVAAARKRIEVLQTTSLHQPLTSVIRKALRLVRESDTGRREVYVLTDMARSAWSTQDADRLRRELDAATDVALYVVDVSASNPQNTSLGEVELPASSIPKNGSLTVDLDVRRIGPAVDSSVVLRLEKPDPRRPIRRDGETLVPESHWTQTRPIELPANGSSRIGFRLAGLEPGVHQGSVELVGRDALSIDDRRYFTIEVKDAWPVLIVAPQGVNTSVLHESLAPYAMRKSGQARFQCAIEQQGNLGNLKLEDYAAVFLLDPQPMAPPLWGDLADYVENGGALAIILGHNASRDNRPLKSFNDEQPQRILAGRLASVWRTAGDIYLAPKTYQHPIMAEFRKIASTVPWNQYPVHRHWELRENPATDNSTLQVILAYGNNVPALIERRIGRGTAFTMTTPVSESARPEGRRRWNDLSLGDALPYFILVNEMCGYMVESGNNKMNYLVGEAAVIPNDVQRYPDQYQLFTPTTASGKDEPPRTVQASDGRVVYRFTDRPGAYRLKGSRGGPVVRGFSVNLPASDSELTAIEPPQLDQILGPDAYQFARNRKELNRGQGEARIGREFFSLLMVAVALMLAMEYLLANRFYQSGSHETSAAKSLISSLRESTPAT